MLRNVTNILFSNKALRDDEGSRLIFVTFLHHQGAVSELLGFPTKNPQSYCKTIAYRTCLWKTWVYLWKSFNYFVERMGNQWGESTGKIRIAKKSEVRLLAPRIRVNTKNAPHLPITPPPHHSTAPAKPPASVPALSLLFQTGGLRCLRPNFPAQLLAKAKLRMSGPVLTPPPLYPPHP